MKKKILSTLLSGAMLVATMQGICTNATGERIYTDLHYVSTDKTVMRTSIQKGDVYVDINFQGFDGIRNGRIYIEIGDGFDFISDINGNALYQSIDAPSRGIIEYDAENSKRAVIVFAAVDNADNGTYYRLYLRPNENYKPENAVVQVNCDFLVGLDENGSPVTYIDYEQPQEMLESYEYMIGDVDNDGRVNTSDASAIFTALSNNGNVPFYLLNGNKIYTDLTYKNWFPDAVCAASPDANQDNVINRADANDIMTYYGNISSGQSGYLSIGEIEVYEVFKY